VVDLIKNEKPFGLMTPEDQEALKAWPHGWENYYVDETWQDCPEPDWFKTVTYRAKPEPMAENLERAGRVMVEKVEDHEDGSATYTFELDEEATKLAQEVGLQFLLYCGASGIDVQGALNMILEKRGDD